MIGEINRLEVTLQHLSEKKRFKKKSKPVHTGKGRDDPAV